MPLSHDPDEILALGLLSEVQNILASAIDSLGNKAAPSIETNYLFHTAVGLNRVAEGFFFLRNSFRVHASKILVRSAIELLVYGNAALKSKDFHFRKAYTEWFEDKKLLAKSNAEELEADNALADLKQHFSMKLPGYPIECKKLTILEAAKMANLEDLYKSQFAIYSQYTHGSLRALTGDLDKATDSHDTNVMSWCVMITIDHLKENTPAEVPDMIPFRQRLLAISGVKSEDVDNA